jgi:hypothetical protein
MDTNAIPSDNAIDFAELITRLRRGSLKILGLSFLGVAVGLGCSLAVAAKQTTVSTLRVTFGFPGFERGTYPNGSKFQADDIRAPDVVNEAVKRLGLTNLAPDISSKIRGAIGISGFVSPNIIKERDRLRATGQSLSPYFPDEYEISISLPRGDVLEVRQRELLLTEIINCYQEKFRRNYVTPPPEFTNAFAGLEEADFVEYELILTRELQALSSYLEQRAANDNSQAGGTKQFRSPTNNLSFQDLLKDADLFTQVRLNEVLGQIYVKGLSKDRTYALVKMDYRLRTLDDMEQRLKEEEAVVTGLLTKTQERAQNYVLATKNTQTGQPLMDQGFIDSLLANDAYNFLVRRALDAGLAVKRVQADKARLMERRQRMESFSKSDMTDQATAIAAMQTALANLETGYKALLAKVRIVIEDYARQEYADAVRISMQARTDSLFRTIASWGALGGIIGFTFAIGISLLNLGAERPPV